MDELLVDAALVRLVRRSLSLVIKLSSHPPHKTSLESSSLSGILVVSPRPFEFKLLSAVAC